MSDIDTKANISGETKMAINISAVHPYMDLFV